ncbi:MAG: hypothetical protein NTW30_05615 [Candidatus Aenigmarchaeota archaeon]|nr:hypothetical protein [Candidatus Aenigmarchaeota archaeon]
MITTAQFNDLVKNALVKWREGFDKVSPAARQMYDVVTTGVQTSEHSQIDGPGFARRKQEGQRYAIGDPVQGYSLKLTQARIGFMESVTWEMRKFDKYREIDKVMRRLGETTAQRMELDLTHQFTFGMTASSYTNIDGETVATTAADGVQIFSASHTMKGATGNVSNYITDKFSRAGLEAAEQKFTLMRNNAGTKVIVKPDTIITSDDPATVNAVAEFLKSMTAPDTANRADNVYHAKYKHLVLPYLATDASGNPDSTKTNYWMLADLSHTDAILEIAENPTFTAPKVGGNGEDFLTDDWSFKSSATYDYGVADFKFIVGSLGSV